MEMEGGEQAVIIRVLSLTRYAVIALCEIEWIEYDSQEVVVSICDLCISLSKKP